jgi:hypothetical protein
MSARASSHTLHFKQNTTPNKLTIKRTSDTLNVNEKRIETSPHKSISPARKQEYETPSSTSSFHSDSTSSTLYNGQTMYTGQTRTSTTPSKTTSIQTPIEQFNSLKLANSSASIHPSTSSSSTIPSFGLEHWKQVRTSWIEGTFNAAPATTKLQSNVEYSMQHVFHALQSYTYLPARIKLSEMTDILSIIWEDELE